MVCVKEKPCASIAFTAWSVTWVTSVVNSLLLPLSAESRPLDFSSSTRVISDARVLTTVLISSALPTKLRATSALTPSNVRSTSPAFCLSTLLTPVDIAVSERSTSCALVRIASVLVLVRLLRERSASPALVLIAFASSSIRALSASAAARLRTSIWEVTNSARPIEQFLEPSDASVEIAGDLHRAIAERVVDIRDLGADLLGEFGAARVDGPGHVADTLVERGNDLLAAFGKGLGDIHHARAERVIERLGATVERFLEARQTLVECRGDLGRLGGDLVVERIDISAHRLAHVLSALPKPLDQFSAIGLHRAVELREMARDQAAERGRVARDLLGQLDPPCVNMSSNDCSRVLSSAVTHRPCC